MARLLVKKNIISKGLPVYDSNGRLIGYTGDDDKIYDATGKTGKIVGVVGTDGIVRDMSGKTIGQLSKPVYDTNGKLIGFTGPDGKVRDINHRVIGSVDADGVVRDVNGAVIGKAGQIAVGTPVYDTAGNVTGFLGPDGKVRDTNGNILGVMGLDGQVKDINDNVVASIVKPNNQNIQKTFKSDQQSNLASSSTEDKNLTPEQLARKNMAEAYAKERMMTEDKQLSQLVQQKQQAMSTQANQLLAAWAPPTQQYVVGQSAKDNADDTANASDSSNQANNDSTKKASAGPVFIKAGTIYYAVINTSINSDEPGPIMGTVIDGEFKGGKLLGTLTNQGKAVMLSFNILTLPQFSKSIPINAVAIDQNTARTGLSTETDNHYLLRYGTLFASSFISGYSQAIASSGSTVETTLLGTVKTTPPLSPREKFAMALGNVGTQFGNQLGSIFTKPPTVYVAAGTAVGILFMSDVSLPTS